MQTRVPSLGRRGQGWVVLQSFRWVRHPIYSGVLLTALGACLISGSWLALAFWLALCVLLDLKSRREELWLAERHPEYTEYLKQTRKFVPWLY